MSKYFKDLLQRVGISFASTLAGLALAAQPFNVLTFDWASSLVASASAAILVLLAGVAAKTSGDPDSAGFLK